jgi:hypothetical protein
MAVSVRREPGRLAAWLAFTGILAALNYSVRLTGEESPDDVLYRWSTAVGGLAQYGIFLAIVLAILAGRPKREYLALRRPSSWRVAAGGAASVFVGVMLLSAIVSQFADPREEQGLLPEAWDPSRAAPYAANFVVIAGVAPVVEELAFRGLGFTLLAPFGRATAIVVLGLVFALSHGLVEGFPILAAFGMGLAYLRDRTQSVYPGIIVHAVFNTVAMLVAVRFFQESGHASSLLGFFG